jgi:hypothetical protein
MCTYTKECPNDKRNATPRSSNHDHRAATEGACSIRRSQASSPGYRGRVAHGPTVIGAFVATVASAARGLAAMLAEFVRLATAMLAAMVLMLIVILVAVACLPPRSTHAKMGRYARHQDASA